MKKSTKEQRQEVETILMWLNSELSPYKGARFVGDINSYEDCQEVISEFSEIATEIKYQTMDHIGDGPEL